MEFDHALVTKADGAEAVAGAMGSHGLCNAVAEAMFGHSRGGASRTALELDVPGELRERHWHGHHQVLASGETQYVGRTLAAPAVRADGTRISIELTVAPARDEAEGLSSNGAIISNVTDPGEEQRALVVAVTQLEAELANLRR